LPFFLVSHTARGRGKDPSEAFKKCDRFEDQLNQRVKTLDELKLCAQICEKGETHVAFKKKYETKQKQNATLELLNVYSGKKLKTGLNGERLFSSERLGHFSLVVKTWLCLWKKMHWVFFWIA
jgi:hypothetical protein